MAPGGAATIAASLADGVMVSQSVPIGPGGEIPLYASPYGGKGSLFGWLTLINSTSNDITGPLLWTKTPQTSGAFYRAGFINEVLTLGSRYSPSNKPALNFSNAIVRLEGGNLMAPLTNNVSLNTLNKVVVAAPNPNKLALTVNIPLASSAALF